MHSIAYWKMKYNSDLMNQNFMIPCNLCKHLLHNFSIRKTSSKLRHVLQITNRIPFSIWKSYLNIIGKIVNKSLHFHLTIKKTAAYATVPLFLNYVILMLLYVFS